MLLQLKPLKTGSQAMDPFPSFSDTFGTLNTSTKVATASTSDSPSNNREGGSINVIKNSYANRLNGEKSKKDVNFCNAADVSISLESVLEVMECFENLFMGFFWAKELCSNMGMESMLENGTWLIRNLALILRKWSLSANVSKEDLKSTTNAKKDMNSNKVSNNNNSSSKSMVDVASSSGTNIVTSNLFDVLNMVEKDTPAAPRDSVNSKGDDLNVGNSIVV
ncbi:hypothetical protein Tco_1372430 [Tanacetum coccineum]